MATVLSKLLNPKPLAPHRDQDLEKHRDREGPIRREKGKEVVRRSSRQRGLRGRSARGKRNNGAAVADYKMSSERNSSSEAMESNEEAIARGMMHLAIACTHVERLSKLEDAAAGTNCLPGCL